jgi:hypothetical protein
MNPYSVVARYPDKNVQVTYDEDRAVPGAKRIKDLIVNNRRDSDDEIYSWLVACTIEWSLASRDGLNTYTAEDLRIQQYNEDTKEIALSMATMIVIDLGQRNLV